jgi:hypothetical protein
VTLRATQTWFEDAITAPESRPSLVSEREAADRLTRGPKLSALERLEIYRSAYHARLVECLIDDYPALRAALGGAAFEALCRDYIAHHPSMRPSLNYFGAGMVAFCRERGLERGFAADLAALEWAIVEVIHSAGRPPLTPARLAEIPADAWGEARLELTPAHRIVRAEYPVNGFFQAFRDGDGASPRIPETRPSATLVYRGGPTVWRMDLSEPMLLLLEALAGGSTLGEALDRAASAMPGVLEIEAGRRLMAWFQGWMSGGLFAGVSLAAE